MRKTSVASWMVLVLVSVGCKKNEGGGKSSGSGSATTSVASGSAPAPVAGSGSADVGSGSAAGSGSGSAAAVVPAPTGPTAVVGTAAGQPLTFTHANVLPSSAGIGIQLFPSKVDCGTRWADVYVSISLPPGKDGKYFSGQTLPPPVIVYAAKGDDNKYEVHALSTVKLEEFELKEGGKIKGTLEVQHKRKEGDAEVKLSGPFEAEICSVPPPVKVPPVATTPVSGKLNDKPFSYKSAILVMKHDDGNHVDVADTLYLYAKPGMTCDSDRTDRAKTGEHVRVWGFGGVNSKVKTTGKPIPATGGIEDKTTNTNLSEANSWVQFDEVALEEKGTAKGTMMIDAPGKPATRVSGTFTATVCK